jgi:hypothetical protein
MTRTHLSAILAFAATAVVAAQVPVHEEPHHRVAFANADLRILAVNLPPGEMSLDHRHDFDVATVSLSSGTSTREQVPGKPWGDTRPSRALGHVSIVDHAGKPGVHKVENTGKAAYQLFAVENLRKSGWTTTPAVKGLATTMAAESRAFRMYDVQLARERSQTSHTHARPTIAVLISGAVLSDAPDAQAKALAPAPVGLKQLTQPGEWLMIPAGDTHHVVRLGTGDARLVEIELR